MTFQKITDEHGDSYYIIDGHVLNYRGFQIISREQWNKDNPDGGKEYYDDLKLPKRATALAAGYDIFAPYSIIINPNQEMKIGTGIKAYMMDDEMLSVYPRSGLGFKYFLRLANTIGIVDADYHNNERNEGHIYIKIRNEGSEPLVIEKGSAFAQAVFGKYLLADGDCFSGNVRKGGIGHTDEAKSQ